MHGILIQIEHVILGGYRCRYSICLPQHISAAIEWFGTLILDLLSLVLLQAYSGIVPSMRHYVLALGSCSLVCVVCESSCYATTTSLCMCF